MAMPASITSTVMLSECGVSACSAFSRCSSPSCYDNAKPGPRLTDWKPSPPPQEQRRQPPSQHDRLATQALLGRQTGWPTENLKGGSCERNNDLRDRP